MNNTKKQTIDEIDKLLKQLKAIKRKIYCSDYYIKNKERILKQIKEVKKEKSYLLNEKTLFTIQKTERIINFD